MSTSSTASSSGVAGYRSVTTAPVSTTKAVATTASDAVIALRIKHLLPSSIQQAELRISKLRQLFATPPVTLHQAHQFAVQHYVQKIKLLKCVRNVTVDVGADSMSSANRLLSEHRCFPLTACTTVPCTPSRLLTGAFDGLLTLWDTETGEPLASRVANSFYPEDDTPQDRGGYGAVRVAVAHPTLPVVFTSTMFDSMIRAWRVNEAATGPDGSSVKKESSTSPSSSACLEPLARVVPRADEGSGEGETAPCPTGMIRSLAVDPTGRLLASVGDDALMRLWDVGTLPSVVAQRDSPRPVWSPLMEQGGYERVGKLYGVAFHPDGAMVSTSDAGGRVVTWDLRSGRVALQTAAATLRSGGGDHLGAATCVAWSPCGARFASGGEDAVVQIWDARQLHKACARLDPANRSSVTSETGRAVAAPNQLLGHEDVVTSLSFRSCPSVFFKDNNGGVSVLSRVLPLALVTTSLDGSVRLWDYNTGVCVNTLEAVNPVRAHAWLDGGAQDGSLITIGKNPVNSAKSWFLWGPAEAGVAVEDIRTSATVVHTSRSTGAAGELDGPAAESSAEEEEEEDMSLLMKREPTTKGTALTTIKEEEEDDDDEDEMALLRSGV